MLMSYPADNWRALSSNDNTGCDTDLYHKDTTMINNYTHRYTVFII